MFWSSAGKWLTLFESKIAAFVKNRLRTLIFENQCTISRWKETRPNLFRHRELFWYSWDCGCLWIRSEITSWTWCIFPRMIHFLLENSIISLFKENSVVCLCNSIGNWHCNFVSRFSRMLWSPASNEMLASRSKLTTHQIYSNWLII